VLFGGGNPTAETMVVLLGPKSPVIGGETATFGADCGGKLRIFPDALIDSVKTPIIGIHAPVVSTAVTAKVFLLVHMAVYLAPIGHEKIKSVSTTFFGRTWFMFNPPMDVSSEKVTIIRSPGPNTLSIVGELTAVKEDIVISDGPKSPVSGGDIRKHALDAWSDEMGVNKGSRTRPLGGENGGWKAPLQRTVKVPIAGGEAPPVPSQVMTRTVLEVHAPENDPRF
jgi:hypothetical protein